MRNLDVLTKTDVRDLIIKELRLRDKLISKMQIDEHIKNEVAKHMKLIYRELDKLRLKENEFENKINKLNI